MLLLYLIISFIYSFYLNKIYLIRKTNLKDNTTRINCNYEIYCLILKIIIFIFFFENIKKDNSIYKYIYECFIIINCLIMSIYTYNNVYFYNNIINKINHVGWYISTWFIFCIIIQTLLNIRYMPIAIILGWIIIIISYYIIEDINEKSLIIKTNIFEFKNNILIEIYKNILLKNLNLKNDIDSKLIKLGKIKNTLFTYDKKSFIHIKR